MSQDAFEARKGIGLLGGTFDPIHQGHLALAASALEQLKLQQIDFLLAPRPVAEERTHVRHGPGTDDRAGYPGVIPV